MTRQQRENVAPLDALARRLTCGFDPDGGPFPDTALRGFDALGLTLDDLYGTITADLEIRHRKTRRHAADPMHQNEHYTYLVSHLVEDLFADFDEGDPGSADEVLNGLKLAAERGLSFADLEAAVKAAVVELEQYDGEVQTHACFRGIARSLPFGDEIDDVFGFAPPRV